MTLLATFPGCPSRLRVVFDQGELGDSGLTCDFGGGTVGPHQKIADGFQLAEGQNAITRIEWWGYLPDSPTGPDNFLFRIYEDDGTGIPQEIHLYALPLGSGHAEDTGLVTRAASGNKPICHYWAEPCALELSPGTPYYFSIVNDVGNWAWLERDYRIGGWGYFRSGDTAPWETTSIDMAFQLWE